VLYRPCEKTNYFQNINFVIFGTPRRTIKKLRSFLTARQARLFDNPKDHTVFCDCGATVYTVGIVCGTLKRDELQSVRRLVGMLDFLVQERWLNEFIDYDRPPENVARYKSRVKLP
jgi:hypothetical protein